MALTFPWELARVFQLIIEILGRQSAVRLFFKRNHQVSIIISCTQSTAYRINPPT